MQRCACVDKIFRTIELHNWPVWIASLEFALHNRALIFLREGRRPGGDIHRSLEIGAEPGLEMAFSCSRSRLQVATSSQLPTAISTWPLTAGRSKSCLRDDLRAQPVAFNKSSRKPSRPTPTRLTPDIWFGCPLGPQSRRELENWRKSPSTGHTS